MEDERVEVMYGLTEGECGLLCILYNFGTQDSIFFKKSGVQYLIDKGYANFNLKTQEIIITEEGNKIGSEVHMWKLNKIREIK